MVKGIRRRVLIDPSIGWAERMNKQIAKKKKKEKRAAKAEEAQGQGGSRWRLIKTRS